MNRRAVLFGGTAAAGLAAAVAAVRAASGRSEGDVVATGLQTGPPPANDWRALTDAEWRERLTPEQFRVLRREATERRFTSPLNDEKRAGVYHCAGCDLPLFDAAWKYDSGTGWPSFWRAYDEALGFKEDFSWGMRRIEYHCARCGGHQGHVFPDGPPPTGQRFCNNGVALTFRPADA